MTQSEKSSVKNIQAKDINARNSNINAVQSLAEILKTTLGPFGLDKMLIDSYGKTTITNDGVKILKEMPIEHPGAKILVDIAKTQDEKVGDGTTSVILFCAEMLKQAKILLKKNIHPNTIIKVYEQCSKQVQEILEKEKIKININDKKIIKNIIETAIKGKITDNSIQTITKLILSLIDSLTQKDTINLDFLQIQTAKGSLEESEVFNGIIINKKTSHANMPTSLKKAKTLLLDFPLELKEPEKDTNISLHSVEEYEKFMEHEKQELILLVQKIKELQATFIVCQKGIDPSVSYYLAKEGILAISRCRISNMEILSKGLQIPIISSSEDLVLENLGICDTIKTKVKNKENLLYIEKKTSPLTCLLLKGSSEHFLQEVERSIEDALKDIQSVYKTKSIFAGGGAIEIELFKQIKEFSKNKLNKKEKLIANYYANALLIIPKTLSSNAGLNTKILLPKIINSHKKGNNFSGISSNIGFCKDTIKDHIIEPSHIKKYALQSANEATALILRVDDIIAVKKVI